MSLFQTLVDPSARQKDPTRIRETLLYIEKANFTADADFVYQFPPMEKVVRIDLVEMAIRGVPTTGGRSDYPYYSVEFDRLPVNSVASNSLNGRILVPLEGVDSRRSYSEGFVIRKGDVPMDLYEIRTRVYRSDNRVATSTDIDSIVVVMRVYQDLGAQGWGA